MEKKDKNNFLYLEDFIIRFTDIMSSALSSLKGKHTISEIEKFINEYLRLCYQIMSVETSPDLINDFIKKSSIDNKDKLFLSEENPDDQLYKFSYIIASQLLHTILLYKKGYLPSMTQSPFNFIKDILLSTLPFHQSSKDKINQELRTLLNNIDQGIWYFINQKPYSDITIFYWESFDKCPQDSLYHISKAIDIVSENVKPDPNSENFENKYCDFIKNPQKVINYNSYFKKLDFELQNSFKKPDIIFLDTSLISEYKNKGVIIPFASIDKHQDYEKHFWEDQVLEIGKTLDGKSLDVYPISRNFHVAAKGEDVNIDIDGLTVESISEDLHKLTEKWHLKDVDKVGLTKFFTGKLTDKDLTLKIYKSFVINSTLPNNFFIPLQFARGAHAAYSFFAYTANCNNSQKSFIEVKENETASKDRNYFISLYEKKVLSDRLCFFYELVFNYVPVVSLILDHKYSGFIRDKFKNNWFDYCLPVEASIFQQSNIIFSKNPIKTDGGTPLSCLGGFALAITHDCQNPYKAVEIIKEISLNRVPRISTEITEAGNEDIEMKKILQVVSEFKFQKVFQSIILNESITKIKDANSILLSDYIKTPKDIAIRPSFIGWKELEMIISDIMRLNVFSLFIFRQVIFQHLNNLNELVEFNIGDEFITNACDNYCNIVYNDLISRNITTYFKDQFYEDKNQIFDANLVKLEIENWVKNAFKFSIIEKVYIKEIVNRMISDFSKDNSILDSISYLSESTTNALYSKIESYSFFNNYELTDKI